MCVICSDLIKDKLTSREALRNLGELVKGRELHDDEQVHVMEVLQKIEERLAKELPSDKPQ